MQRTGAQDVDANQGNTNGRVLDPLRSLRAETGNLKAQACFDQVRHQDTRATTN
jgi:hypothetical protein